MIRGVVGYEGLYTITDSGDIFSTRSNRLLKPTDNGYGYLYATMTWYDGTSRKEMVHVLVAKAFIPNAKQLPEVNHKDECKTNNKDDNLEWCNRLYNNTYSFGKKVEQLLNGVVIDTHDSIRSAARKVGLKSHEGILNCCKGVHLTAKGYEWRYIQVFAGSRPDSSCEGLVRDSIGP